MSTYIIDLISHLTLRKIGLTRIKTLSPPMVSICREMSAFHKHYVIKTSTIQKLRYNYEQN